MILYSFISFFSHHLYGFFQNPLANKTLYLPNKCSLRQHIYLPNKTFLCVGIKVQTFELQIISHPCYTLVVGLKNKTQERSMSQRNISILKNWINRIKRPSSPLAAYIQYPYTKRNKFILAQPGVSP